MAGTCNWDCYNFCNFYEGSTVVLIVEIILITGGLIKSGVLFEIGFCKLLVLFKNLDAESFGVKS